MPELLSSKGFRITCMPLVIIVKAFLNTDDMGKGLLSQLKYRNTDNTD
jgi:hypothetical protein